MARLIMGIIRHGGAQGAGVVQGRPDARADTVGARRFSTGRPLGSCIVADLEET